MACKNVWKRFFEMIVQGVQRVCGDIAHCCRPRPGGAHKQQRAAQGKNGSRTLEPSRRWHREPEGLSGGQCTIGLDNYQYYFGGSLL